MEMDKDQKLNDLFSQARTETPEVGFEEIQGFFLANMDNPIMETPTTETSNLFTIKTWTIMITTIITVAATTYLLVGNPVAETTHKIVEEESLEKMSVEADDLFLTETEDFLYPEMISAEVYIPEFSPEEEIERVVAPVDPQIPMHDTVRAIFSETKSQNEEYRFPVLSEEEKKMYTKQKSVMIKQLIKRDKKMFAYAPPGSMNLEFADITVRPFHIQVTEVTNLQYRTFLFDILEQGRRSDFLEAKPDQSLWAKDFPEYNQPMVDLYFSHPAYDLYPVNNISRKGAEMYCNWLTTQANEVLASKNKPALNDVRLPTVFEWIYAARGGMKTITYPWGGPYNRNAKGCYLANFNPEGESPDQDGAMHTAKVYSYSPNDFGLYCMSGNVAEMIYYSSDKSEPGTKGGSFLSTSENIQINGTDAFKGVTEPNVNIGFRVVISYGIIGVKGG